VSNFDPQVGDKIHVCFFSDVVPGTVIKRTAKRCHIRYDSATKHPDWSPDITPGGYAGHCVNQDSQKWIITENPDGRVSQFFLHKSGQWRMSFAGSNESGRSARLGPGWRNKYDYNF